MLVLKDKVKKNDLGLEKYKDNMICKVCTLSMQTIPSLF